jgi:hypothetical protein
MKSEMSLGDEAIVCEEKKFGGELEKKIVVIYFFKKNCNTSTE